MADVLEAAFNASVTNVTIPTTTETTVITTPPISVVRQTVFAMVIAHAQLSTGAGTTDVAKTIRRGSTTSDPLVGEANAEPVTVAAENTQQLMTMIGEELADLAEVRYQLSLTQTGATGNGTVLQASILVLLM